MLTDEQLLEALDHTLDAVDIPALGEKITGKVRDIYVRDGERILITSDRVSAFDRVLGLIPHKGQMLNQLSAWWFEKTADLCPNHLLNIPDPNVTIAREAQPLPVEVVVRGYITGVTKTSLWYLYEQGDRQPYGISLPDGLQKNDPLPEPLITPTTKAEKGGHDERLTRDEILAQRLVEPSLWAQIEETAVSLYKRGRDIAAKHGLILVDTKYEMGLIDGQLTLIDEIHTPDSSRYWSAKSYASGKMDHYDKEFLRQWYAARGYRGDGTPPTMPPEFRAQVAARYLHTFETLTGETFVPGKRPIAKRIAENLTP